MEITKTYAQVLPATRFIGKKYGEADSINGGFGAKWADAFATGLFETIEAAEESEGEAAFYEDSDAYIGLMYYSRKAFWYWIGKFTAPDTSVPEGFDSLDFPESQLGVAWIYGKENELYGHEAEALQKLEEIDLKPKYDDTGACWSFERYQCPRFTTPDQQGYVILDICFFVK